MDATTHGVIRIFGRTKMRVDDVLSVIEGKAAVELGRSDGLIYFLFYSPPDGRTKIALVPENLTCVISVWENNYHLPLGVTEVDKELNRKARKLLRNFLVSRIGIENIKRKSRTLHAIIDVYEGEDVVYTHCPIKISEEETRSKALTLSVVRIDLYKIADLINENEQLITGRVRYCIRISDPETCRTIASPFFHEHKRITELMVNTT